jgi:hypothetical protein
MLLHLSDAQMQDSQSGISPMQLRQMHIMMDSGDISRLTGPCSGLHHSEKTSITNNSDLLKAFTTMSTEQQRSLLSNINSKLSNHAGGGNQLSDGRQQCGHSMIGFASSHMSVADHNHMLPVDVPPPPIVNGGTSSSSLGHLSRASFSPGGDLAILRYSKDPNYASLLGQSVSASQEAQTGCDQNLSSSIMVDIDVQGETFFLLSERTSWHEHVLPVHAWLTLN